VFERAAGTWQQKAKLIGAESKAYDFFGTAVDV